MKITLPLQQSILELYSSLNPLFVVPSLESVLLGRYKNSILNSGTSICAATFLSETKLSRGLVYLG